MFKGLLQPMHLLLIIVIALIVFGPSKLPQIGAGLGQSIRDFKRSLSGEEDDPSPQNKQMADTTNKEK